MIKNEMSLTDDFYIYFQRYLTDLADVNIKVVIGYNDISNNSAKEETMKKCVYLPISVFSAVEKYPKYIKQILSDVFKYIIDTLISYNKLIIIKGIRIIKDDELLNEEEKVRIEYDYIKGDYDISKYIHIANSNKNNQ